MKYRYKRPVRAFLAALLICLLAGGSVFAIDTTYDGYLDPVTGLPMDGSDGVSGEESGSRTIVRSLNGSGVPNPSTYKCRSGLNFHSRAIGKSPLWSDKTVRRILQDEMYIGNMVQGKNRKVSYKDKAVIPLPQEEWIRVEDTHEAIIGKEDFERVQRMLGSHAKSSPISGEIGLFSGLLRCADCGHALIKKTNHNPDKTYVYYRCSTYCKCKGACSAHSIRHEKLYDTVLACIQKMVEIAVDADEVISEMKRNRTDRYAVNLKEQLEKQELTAEKLKQEMAELYPEYKRGLLNLEQYKRNKQHYEQQLQQVNAGIAKLKASVEDPGADIQTNAFIEHFKQHRNIDALTRPLLTELIEQITVQDNGALDITFCFHDAFEEAKQITKEKSA